MSEVEVRGVVSWTGAGCDIATGTAVATASDAESNAFVLDGIDTLAQHGYYGYREKIIEALCRFYNRCLLGFYRRR